MSATTITPDSLVTPESITAKSRSNFALSFFFLPKAKRQGITNFYALSRVIDDAVDDYGVEEGQKLIEFWKKEIQLCYQGTPTHPVTQAMQTTIRQFNIPQKYLELLAEGCEWDLSKNRYQTYEELYQYCYRVAGCIGLTCMKIFQVEGEDAEKAAEELGVALQLTNILRDIAEDAKRNRVYLPQEDIQRYGLSETDVIQGKPSKKLGILLKLMADRAETNYERAFTKMRSQPRRPLIAAWIMGKVYYQLLKKIRKNYFGVYSQKIKISKAHKLWIAVREWLRAL